MASNSGMPFYSAFMGGLSDPSTTQYKRRRLVLGIFNNLIGYGLEHQLDLPQIAVVGSQSVGKSSLIESIAGIRLPRAQGTCTRCPIECRLSRSDGPWSCKVFLRLANQVETSFGPSVTDPTEVEERIRRAQLAILNPSKMASDFLGTLGSTNGGIGNELSFSSDLISVRISGEDVDDLSFVDLPGVISSVRDGGRENDIDEVKNLVLKVIEKPSCLILLVVSGETDLENQAGRRLVIQVDPEGSRTIPVLTKPDRIANGEHDSWVDLLKKQDRFRHGWYCVKQCDQQELDSGISWEEARQNETDFFLRKDPWGRLPANIKSRLGTPFLTEALGSKLFDLICKRLPDLLREVENRVQSLIKDIGRLPTKSTEDPLKIILRLTAAFKKDVEQLIKGRPEAGEAGIVQRFRKSKEQFSKAIANQAPEFKPYERPTVTKQTPIGNLLQMREYSRMDQSSMSELEQEVCDELIEDLDSSMEDRSTFVYLDEVLDVAKYAITRELPHNYPYAIREHYVARFTKKWPLPAMNLFQNLESNFTKELDALVAKHFSEFAPGDLDDAVQRTVQEQLKKCARRTRQRILECLALEQEEPATVDEETLALHKMKFRKNYTKARQTHIQKTSTLKDFIDGSYDHSPMPSVFQYLRQMGIENVQKDDLLRLLPMAMDEAAAIDIMCEVSAYYQVAFKRFVDYIPMIIDFELLKGFSRTLDDALYHGLQLGEGNTRERCATFLKEDPAVVRLRNTLCHDLERFEGALTALKRISSLSSGAAPSASESRGTEVFEETEQSPGNSAWRVSTPDGYVLPDAGLSFHSGDMVPPPSKFANSQQQPDDGGAKKKKGKKTKLKK